MIGSFDAFFGARGLRYEEWRPAADIEPLVVAFWRVTGSPHRIPFSPLLPGGFVELVMNLGAPLSVEGATFRGEAPAISVVGLLSRSLKLTGGGAMDTLGIRLHPSRASAFLRQSATSLSDRVQALDDVCGPLADALRRSIVAVPRPASVDGRAALADAIRAYRAPAATADPDVDAIVDGLLTGTVSPIVGELARRLAISPRHLRRRFHDAVGVSPKRFVRIVRFARAWQSATAHPTRGWAAVAAESGYADQAHLVREFRAVGAIALTQLLAIGPRKVR